MAADANRPKVAKTSMIHRFTQLHGYFFHDMMCHDQVEQHEDRAQHRKRSTRDVLTITETAQVVPVIAAQISASLQPREEDRQWKHWDHLQICQVVFPEYR